MNAPGTRPPALDAVGLSRTFRRGREEVHALVDVSLRIEPGESVAIVGPSGSGKSTLLNLLGCMDRPTRGTLSVDGVPVESLDDAGRTRIRGTRLGFVFQQFGLVPTLTAAENVALPALFAGRPVGDRVRALLDRVDLAHRAGHRPHELSGGEMQRVAIARALVNDPALLLADEPTGNLDSETGAAILGLLRGLNASGLTVVLVTHSPELVSSAGRVLRLRDGRLVGEPGR